MAPSPLKLRHAPHAAMLGPPPDTKTNIIRLPAVPAVPAVRARPPPPRQVIAHMMPDLPNVGWERDVESLREFFENPAFRTDGLKLYPTLVIRGTGLYELWKKGLYKNYAPDKVGGGGWRVLNAAVLAGGSCSVVRVTKG